MDIIHSRHKQTIYVQDPGTPQVSRTHIYAN